jgi:thymidylate kinase
MQNQTLQLSPTLEGVQRKLAKEDAVAAVDIMRLILEQHPEYGNKAAPMSLVPSKGGDNKHISAWLNDVRSLFDEEAAPVLHGRLVIIGLSMLDDDLKQQLDQYKFLTELHNELKEPKDSLLINASAPTSSESSAEADLPKNVVDEVESVGTQADNPIQHIADDQLGRAAYAKYLAKRLTAISDENKATEDRIKEQIKAEKVDEQNNSQLAYAVHLYGPWGSGKSTLLNFIRTELEQENWLVVEFNAWRNQQIKPPWWALMESVFQQSKASLSATNLICEYWWRLRLGKGHYFLYIFLSACLFGLGFVFFKDTIFDGSENWFNGAKNISIGVTTVVGAWAAVQGLSHSLLFGSSKKAEEYLSSSSNPMENISNRFANLIERIEQNKSTKRVMIIIDDLDRCQGQYVVDLLEGFQTLFRKKSVFFIVAADQRWLNACFEEVYSKLRPHVQEPGKHLGILFLEKVFQFSAPVPGIPQLLREDYLHHLLNMKGSASLDDIKAAQSKAKEEMDSIQKDAQIGRAIEKSSKLSFVQERATRAEAAVRFASPQLSKDIEAHTLAPFTSLIEPNPRSMKRLVNAYSINRVLSILGHLDIAKEQIVLWTILTMRWPELANHLEKVAEDLKRIGKERNAEDNSSISILLEDKNEKITDVVSGKGLPASLDIETIKSCAMLKA